MLLAVAGVAAALSTAGLVLAVDVERPLRRLERALSVVGEGGQGDSGRVPEEGAAVVRQVSRRFNAMVDRLAASQRERNTMLAGIAHDLRSPITRLRLRVSFRTLPRRTARVGRVIWMPLSGSSISFCCTPVVETVKR